MGALWAILVRRATADLEYYRSVLASVQQSANWIEQSLANRRQFMARRGSGYQIAMAFGYLDGL